MPYLDAPQVAAEVAPLAVGHGRVVQRRCHFLSHALVSELHPAFDVPRAVTARFPLLSLDGAI